MKKINFGVISIVAVIAASAFLCVGCNDGGVENGGGDAVAYLTKFKGSAGAVYGPPLIDESDGKTYRTVIIGDQTWMAENLNRETPNGSRCYDNAAANCSKYGRLYNWETAVNICPAGWKLPDGEDWMQLLDRAGLLENAGKKLKAKTGWDWNYEDDVSGNGTDDFGFSAMPGGYFGVRIYEGEYLYGGAGYLGNWWRNKDEDEKTWDHNPVSVAIYQDNRVIMYMYVLSSEGSLSVRCVKEEI